MVAKGRLFTKQFDADADGRLYDSAAKLWAKALAGLRFEDLERGADRLATDKIKYFPNPADFRELCEPRREDFGCTDPSSALDQALRFVATEQKKRPEIHLAILKTIELVGEENLKGWVVSDTRYVFKVCYEILVQRIMRGQHIGISVPDHLKVFLPEQARPSNPAVAKSAINKAREILSGVA